MRVSVIIAAYNVRGFITRAIDSVRAQTFRDWELLVVDDASDDGTPDHVAALAQTDPRISLIRQERNMGPSAARNRGIEATRGEWIAVLDADDVWRPERLEKLLQFAAETESDFVADDLILFDEALQREVGVAFNFPDAVTHLNAEHLFSFSADDPSRLGLMQPLIRRSFLLKTGLRYDERLRSAEDLLFYADLLFHGLRAAVSRDAYYVYTMRVGLLSRQRASGSRSKTSLEFNFWIADTLAERYKARITPQTARGIERFRQLTRRRWIASEITRFRQARHFWPLAVFLIRHPQGAVRYVLTLRTWARTFGQRAAQ